MKEIWKASADPGNWQAQPRSALLPWWWFLWILSCIVANAMFRYTLKTEELDELINASGSRSHPTRSTFHSISS